MEDGFTEFINDDSEAVVSEDADVVGINLDIFPINGAGVDRAGYGFEGDRVKVIGMFS